MLETTFPKSTGPDPVGTGSNFVDRLAQGAHQAVDQAAASAKPALEKLQVSGAAAREALTEKAGRQHRYLTKSSTPSATMCANVR